VSHAPFPYQPPPELRGAAAERRKVLVVGAGPVGLAAAIDLAQHGIAVTVLDDNDVVSVGSRAICWSKRTLEIFDRLGVGERMVGKGVTWQIGRVYHRDQELYRFDLLPEDGHQMPAFINLQQYHVEQYLVERAAELADYIDLRWKNKAVALTSLADGVAVEVETPDGRYTIETEWLVAADGARSTVRAALGLPFEGEVFEEKFLIADVRLQADFPSDRRFWFEPSFNPGQSVLIHRQPDDILHQGGPRLGERRGTSVASPAARR
jgi:3-(3-hydroxy-phenyl)propionate hydroxylase